MRTTISRPYQFVPLLLDPQCKLERGCEARRGRRDFSDYERVDPYALRYGGAAQLQAGVTAIRHRRT